MTSHQFQNIHFKLIGQSQFSSYIAVLGSPQLCLKDSFYFYIYAKSKIVEVVTVSYVDDEDHVNNSLLQVWKLRFGHKAKRLTYRSYLGKKNSTLGSVVPLAMFL